MAKIVKDDEIEYESGSPKYVNKWKFNPREMLKNIFSITYTSSVLH